MSAIVSTSRQRVLDALNHRQPAAIPIDFGASPITGLHCQCVANLRRHYGLPDEPVKVVEPYQMLGWVDDELKRVLGVDVEGVFRQRTMFGYANENWKQWRTPWGQTVLVGEKFNTTVDAQGNTFVYPEGDTSVSPSGQMPANGFFFDAVMRQEPIDDDKLDPRDNLKEFVPLSDSYLRQVRRQVAEAKTTDRALLLALPGSALGDIAQVPAPYLKHPRGIRDVAEWYMSIVARPGYLHAVFDKQVDIAIGNFQRLFDAVGNDIDVVLLCGTDFGTQNSTFCSPDTFKSLYLPYYKRMTDWIHGHTTWHVFKHSCGAVVPLLNLFIEAGFDILNPVQCSARGMDPSTLKQVYGDRLVFWGGGVDTQKTLPFGTPQQVREEVLRRCEIFAPGGGFVFNAIHNVQANTPTENVVAMIEAVKEYNGRS